MPITLVPPKPPAAPAFSRQHQARRRRVTFEAGYAQRSAEPNPVQRTPSIEWRHLTAAERDQLVAFFTARKGSEAFLYAAPGDPAPTLWTCAEWSDRAASDGKWSVSARFTEEFDPI